MVVPVDAPASSAPRCMSWFLLLTLACGGNGGVAPDPDPPDPPGEVVLVGAGDIAACYSNGDEITAALLDDIEGTVFTAGDNAYQNGTRQEFRDCYDPSWGRHKARTRPAPGNHDYFTDGAVPYFEYFDALAGPSGRGYYSYDLGAWHILSLNSGNQANRDESEQIEWLLLDLAANPAECTLAYWHHPVFSSGRHGGTNRMRQIWRILDEAEVDVVISGHDHNYERFDPQDAEGRPDPRGIRGFIVGTGGESLRPMEAPQPNSVARNGSTLGVLKLVLRDGSYEWEFVPEPGAAFRDAGSAECVS